MRRKAFLVCEDQGVAILGFHKNCSICPCFAERSAEDLPLLEEGERKRNIRYQFIPIFSIKSNTVKFCWQNNGSLLQSLGTFGVKASIHVL